MVQSSARACEAACPVCKQTGKTVSLDTCCGECAAVLQWFQNRLELVGYRPSLRISLTSSFAGDLAIDSLDFVEIVCDLERDFKVVVLGSDAIQIATVGDAVACVRRMGQAQEALVEVAAPRRRLPVAPAGLRVQLSKILAQVRRPR